MDKETPTPTPPSSSVYLDKARAATLLGISPRTLDLWMRDRIVPYLKIRRTVRFSAADIDDYLQRHCRVAAKMRAPTAATRSEAVQ